MRRLYRSRDGGQKRPPSDFFIHPVGVVFHQKLGISSNNELLSLHGLEALEHASQLELWGNPKLHDLSAWQSLGSLKIAENDALTSLAGLEPLANLGSLFIDHNTSLATLEALHDVSMNGGDIWIERNCALSDEDAWALVEHIESGGGVVGDVEIKSNGPLCEA